MGPMSEFKGIPVVTPPAASAEPKRSGQKYVTPQGFTAIRDGIKPGASKPEPAVARKPNWLRAPLPAGRGFDTVRQTVREHRLATVCEEAKCPNIGECWNAGTATIMLMGEVCTRACRFCAVDTGNPRGWLDAEEPANAARTVQLMGLKYVVLTSVNRDDLPDGGAGHFAACVREIRQLNPGTAVEALTPDFQGVMRDVETVVDSGLDVFAQNVETVRRLTHPVRDPARFLRPDPRGACAREAASARAVRRAGQDEPDARTRRDGRRNPHHDGGPAHGGRGYPDTWPIPAPHDQSPERRAIRAAGRVRRLSRTRAGSWLPGMRGGSAGALELSRGAGTGAQQRRPGRGRARDNVSEARPTSLGGTTDACVASLAAAGMPVALRWLGKVAYEPTWRAMQARTDSATAASRGRILVSRTSARIHAGHELEGRAPARARQYPGRADRPRWTGDVSRPRPARGVSAACPFAAWHRRAGARRGYRERHRGDGGGVGYRGAGQARRAWRLRRRAQACEHRVTYPTRPLLSRAGVKRRDGPRTVCADQPVWLRRAADDTAQRARWTGRRARGGGSTRAAPACAH